MRRLWQVFGPLFAQVSLWLDSVRLLIVAFASEWFHSRRYRQLLFGFPALAVLLCFAAGFVPASLPSQRAAVEDWYHNRTTRALEAEDLPGSEMYVLRAAAMTGLDSQWREYILGRLAEQQGHEQWARERMERIAPPEAAGYGPAHLWLAKDILQHRQPLEVAAWNAVHHHLRQALEEDPECLEGHALLGQLYFSVRQLEQASEHLAKAVNAFPSLRLPLARIYLNRGEHDKAESQARAASRHYAARARAGTAESENARVLWADAETLLKNYSEAADILAEGLGEAENDRYRLALAELYVIWAGAVRREEQEKEENGLAELEKLEEAIRLVPDHAKALNRIAAISLSDRPQAKRARQSIERALEQNNVPASARAILGTDAAGRGETALAVEHFEQAYAQGLASAELLNNLAWVLARLDPPQYERALQLLDQAVDQVPEHPEIRETRGQIYVQLGRYADAITDFEAVLPRMKRRASIHEALAEAYQKLGDSAMAEEHRQVAEQLQQQSAR